MLPDNDIRFDVSDLSWLDKLVMRHGRDATRLLQILREIQESFGHIPQQAVSVLAAKLSIPRSRIESVASFYSFLHLKPHGEYRVLFSDNITDRMLGSQDLMDQMCQLLWLQPGKVSEDGLVSIGTTSCTGMCDQGPALLVNGRAITRMTHQRVQEIAQLIRNRTPVADWPSDFFRVEDNIRRSGLLLGNTIPYGAALAAAISSGAHIIEPIKASGLRGRGGAGFPTGLKWEACRDAPGSEHYVVCNADEGEPGTFKDRVLLNSHADLVFEGMTICALAVGARKGFLYLRGEYRYLLEPLHATLQRRRESNLLGESILGRAGFDFDIDIHVGAGAYICGEESALIESLEGKRGVPRNRPPFPVTHGYLQQPTAIDNVETFCQAVLALYLGAERYRAIGTAKSTGSKLISVSGDCPRPGIYEYPFGVSVREVLQDCGAVNTIAVQVSGPSGACVGESEFDRKLGFEDLPTAGAFMVFDDSRDMFEVARNYVHFFAHESCGFCTPCRVGTSMLKSTMDKIANGHGTRYDLNEVENLDRVLQTTSHCGLGRTACNPVLHTLKHFRPAYENRLKSLMFSPAFDLDGSLARARQMTGRDDAGAHLKEVE
ncbi:NAD(P)H-dependent oxidoreductase subunit E [Sideroxydans lithotrophicus]|uniref:Respiratory-chain NADH dehydrogenase domain 51 kDa subunit n=1 Tax=Sideroxydans lithotrophicus (strain ES-1) TaxID=580332 RepID=D5CSA5_SIDLE|nr:NAD(P)H-dependent oxidoreductase subunit E [Sideroxydans lithotrophicus]ADE11841.1 Respiratory-chain NADH dehydrogenase domain 51 kDa subunit [Sideroxydans lithotrophicus ES-1]